MTQYVRKGIKELEATPFGNYVVDEDELSLSKRASPNPTQKVTPVSYTGLFPFNVGDLSAASSLLKQPNPSLIPAVPR